jgi:hypothetical protein
MRKMRNLALLLATALFLTLSPVSLFIASHAVEIAVEVESVQYLYCSKCRGTTPHVQLINPPIWVCRVCNGLH